MREAGEPPRKALRLPDVAERRIGIAVEPVRFLATIEGDQGVRQAPHIGDSEVQSLAARGRHDMRGIAGEKQTAAPHRLDDGAPERRNALLDRGSARHAGGSLRPQPHGKLVPDALVGPLFELLIKRHLQIIAAALARALAGEGEAVGMACIDELVIAGRYIRHDAEPAERISTFEEPRRHLAVADAVLTVAAGDEIAVEPL